MKKIGLQLYSLRSVLSEEEQNLRQIFTKVKEAGYDELQLSGGLGNAVWMGSLANDAGLDIAGTLIPFDDLTENPERTMDIHDELGTKYIGLGYYTYKNADEVMRFIERANAFAQAIASRGFHFMYHHHSHEFIKLDNGRSAMDMLVSGFDKNNISFLLDTYWIQHGGGDVCRWINDLSGRIDMIHLKDMKRIPDGVTFAEVGSGNMNWDGIIKASEKTGIQYFVVEQDSCDGSPLDSIKISSDYLHRNFFN